MGRISASTGLISGIDIQGLVDQLMTLEARPRDILAERQTQIDAQRKAVMDLTSLMLSLKIKASDIRINNQLSAATATSSNENILTATASNGAMSGAYQFTVARLVTTQQVLSAAYGNPAQPAFSAGTITINSAQARLVEDMSLDLLNDGAGVRRGSIRITDRSGVSAVVDLSTALTVDDVLEAINSSAANVQATVSDGSIVLTDLTGQALSNLIVTEVGGGYTAADLGILGSVAGDVLTGTVVHPDLQEVLLAELNGGAGVTTGTVSITDRNGVTSEIDLSAATTVQDVINAINDAGVAADVTASLNASGSGILIVDNTAGAGNLTITDVSGSLAADLNIVIDDAVSQVDSGDLNRAFVSGATRLAALNGGTGVSRGKFSITDSSAASAVIDLTSEAVQTVQDVIDAINAAGIGVTASINATGDGLLLTDTASGPDLLTVAEVSGSAAEDLNILGSAAEGTTYIDGSGEVTIAVTAEDTLTTLAAKLSAAGAGLRASVINDGSETSPYRLSVVAQRSGSAGAILIDTGATGLDLSELVAGKQAVLRIGDAGGESLLVASNSNSVTGVINKVALDLHSADPAQPVTVTVQNDPEAVIESLTGFVKDVNNILAKIGAYTKYDATKQEGAILQGDANLMVARSRIQNLLFHNFSGTGSRYENLAAIGFSYRDGQLQLDADKFRAAFEAHPEDVQKLLGDAEGFLPAVQDLMANLAESGSGWLSIQADRLQTQSLMYQSRIDAMDKLLESRRARLTNQFIAMERALAQLQSQQTALTSLANYAANWKPVTNSG